MTTAPRARHRADVPARTVLTDVASSLSGTAKRSIVVGASSGMVLTMAATSAYAQPSSRPAADTIGTVTLAPEARDALTVTPAVTVEAEQVQADAQAEATAAVPSEGSATATAAPEPEPEPEPEIVIPATRTARNATAAAAAQGATAQGAGTAAAAATQAAAPAAAAPAAAPVRAATTGGAAGIARSKVGSAYVWGASGPYAFDCSGFTAYVYRQLGISLPHQSGAQRATAQRIGTRVPASQAQPGDLMWWPGHVGVYVGNGMMVDAGNPSVGVSERRVYGSPEYYRIG